MKEIKINQMVNFLYYLIKSNLEIYKINLIRNLKT